MFLLEGVSIFFADYRATIVYAQLYVSGPSFRPCYGKIVEIRPVIRNSSYISLTATSLLPPVAYPFSWYECW